MFGNIIGDIAGLAGHAFGADSGDIKGAQAGMDWISKIPGVYHENLDPYAKAGQGAMGDYQAQLQQLLKDPMGFVNKINAGYQQSPYAKFQIDQMTRGANNAAAAGGTLGTGANQFDVAKLIQGLSSADQQQYFNNVMQPYNMGMSGTQDVMHQGYNANNQIAQGTAGAYGDMANLAAAKAQAQGKQTGGFLGGLGSLAGDVMGLL